MEKMNFFQVDESMYLTKKYFLAFLRCVKVVEIQENFLYCKELLNAGSGIDIYLMFYLYTWKKNS
jgi:hypothetical protein